jgi:hypothetical protein
VCLLLLLLPPPLLLLLVVLLGGGVYHPGLGLEALQDAILAARQQVGLQGWRAPEPVALNKVLGQLEVMGRSSGAPVLFGDFVRCAWEGRGMQWWEGDGQRQARKRGRGVQRGLDGLQGKTCPHARRQHKVEGKAAVWQVLVFLPLPDASFRFCCRAVCLSTTVKQDVQQQLEAAAAAAAALGAEDVAGSRWAAARAAGCSLTHHVACVARCYLCAEQVCVAPLEWL